MKIAFGFLVWFLAAAALGPLLMLGLATVALGVWHAWPWLRWQGLRARDLVRRMWG